MGTFQRRGFSFWPLQIGGWLLYALANAAGSIPYLKNEPHYVAYRTTFVVVGFLTSFLMHRVCRVLWRSQTTLLPTLLICASASYALGLAMSASASTAEALVGGPNMDLGWPSVFAAGSGGSFVLMAWGALYFGVKHYMAREATHLELLESEALARSAQLEALRYQLQPHFLFNTLNAISSLVISHQTELASEMIEKLADLLRTSLDSPEVHTITLREELASMKGYLAIEEVRFGPRLAVSYDIGTETENIEVPRFLLQPLVENAIRHGIARRPQGGRIAVRAHRVFGDLIIDIESPQSELKVGHRGQGHGLGLRNTRRRLHALYGLKGRLSIADLPDSFGVSVTLPIAHSTSGTIPNEVRS